MPQTFLIPISLRPKVVDHEIQIMNSVISNNLSLKSGCEDKGIIIFDFVAKTHFLSSVISNIKISKATYTNSQIIPIFLQPKG